jgi:hypothetical protein
MREKFGLINFWLESWRSITKSINKDPGSGLTSQRHGSADPDPHQDFMDPEHCFQNIDPHHPLCPASLSHPPPPLLGNVLSGSGFRKSRRAVYVSPSGSEAEDTDARTRKLDWCFIIVRIRMGKNVYGPKHSLTLSCMLGERLLLPLEERDANK